MDYLWEQLGDEGFQRVCQALVARDYPNVQCFPLNMPDGGRDIVSYHQPGGENIVFQVKFIRRPEADPEPHKTMISLVQDEIHKIARLIPSGTTSYILLTNVSGTGHPESGSIDKVQNIFDEILPVPGLCLWRDDLNRRFESAKDLQWSYPQLLTGSNLLSLLVQEGLHENDQRRTQAVRASLQTAYREDSTIKFKQVDLKNRLADLYVDVPINLPLIQSLEASGLMRVTRMPARYLEAFRDAGPESDGLPGAADFILDGSVAAAFPKMVLEGGPGQGKSTIAQYVCQVHRMKLLEKSADRQALPPEHESAPLRLPLKVDLRDLAAWMRGDDPFDPVMASKRTGPATLEAFLARQIFYASGGIEFDVADLHAVFDLSAVILVLDGLDEVAVIQERRQIVKEVEAAVERLAAATESLHVVITSRPAAFANSPGFSSRSFNYFTLADLPAATVFEYQERWALAQELESQEAADIQNTLAERLVEPHFRDLARNPMQLAILLNLVRTRGSSLPDKRTALYDSYVSTFFDREGEKSDVVKEHRDLLIDLHRFLGWFLHSRAEESSSSGRIPEEELRTLVESYLASEGRDPLIVKRLFRAAVDRVFFLVSRVQGIFEFEVQPLREYFAAKHLYDTAPHSPAGRERSGSKPDIFLEISRNSYWLNVTRFFAGCYSKGELASLVDSLDDMRVDEDFSFTPAPRVLSQALLSDRVFSQNLRAQGEVIDACTRELVACRAFDGSAHRLSNLSPLVLPSGAGQSELASALVERIETETRDDFRRRLGSSLQRNTTQEERAALLAELVNSEDLEKSLDVAVSAGVLATMEESRVMKFVNAPEPSVRRRACAALFEDESPLLDSDSVFAFQVLKNVLNFPPPARSLSRPAGSSPLVLLANVLTMPLPEALFLRGSKYSSEYARAHLDYNLTRASKHKLAIQRQARNVLENYLRVWGEYSEDAWRQDLEPWSAAIEGIRALVGEPLSVRVTGCVAAGIQSRSIRGSDGSSLFDTSMDLSQRARFARLKSGTPGWWIDAIEDIGDSDDACFLVMMAVHWGTSRTLHTLSPVLSDLVDDLSSESFLQLTRALTMLGWRRGATGPVSARGLRDSASPRFLVCLSMRAAAKLDTVYKSSLRNYEGADPIVNAFCMSMESRLAEDSKRATTAQLRRLKSLYRKIRSSPYSNEFHPLSGSFPVSQQDAKAIVESACDFPYQAVAVAEETLWQRATGSLSPIRKIAQEQRWAVSHPGATR